MGSILMTLKFHLMSKDQQSFQVLRLTPLIIRFVKVHQLPLRISLQVYQRVGIGILETTVQDLVIRIHRTCIQHQGHTKLP